MSESDSSGCRWGVERVVSEEMVPKCFDQASANMEFSLKVKTEGKSRKFVYNLKKGSDLPYFAILKGRDYKIYLKM